MLPTLCVSVKGVGVYSTAPLSAKNCERSHGTTNGSVLRHTDSVGNDDVYSQLFGRQSRLVHAIKDATKWPIQLVLRQYVLQGSDIAAAADASRSNEPLPPARTLQMAIVVVATVPILVFYPFLQKYFTKGVLTGAIKG